MDSPLRKTRIVRWDLPLVLLVSVTIAYFDRLNLGNVLPFVAKDYGWSTAQVGENGGTLFTIFFVGYGLSNIFLSPLAERFGVKKSLILAILCFSVFTALTAPLSVALTPFILIRFVLGLGEGIHFPMMATLVKRWFPLQERSRANAIWGAGIFVGTVLAPLIVVPLALTLGWRAMFYVLGAASICLTIPLLWFLIYDSPATHPKISEEEKHYIHAGLEPDEDDAALPRAALKSLLAKKEYWLAMLAGIFNNFCAYGLILWLPSFFTLGRKLPYASLPVATSLPYVTGLIGIVLLSWLGDKTNRRALIAGIGFILAGIFTYFSATAPSIPLIIVFLAIAVFFQTAYSGQEFAVIQRILPKQSVATGAGLYNGLTTMVGGGLGSAIVGGVVAATGSYNYGILTIVLFAVLAGITMLVLSRFLKY